MPKYFFEVHGGASISGSRIVAPQGIELGDHALAFAAQALLLDIARFEHVARERHSLSVTVRDAAGHSVYRSELTIRAEWPDEAR